VLLSSFFACYLSAMTPSDGISSGGDHVFPSSLASALHGRGDGHGGSQGADDGQAGASRHVNAAQAKALSRRGAELFLRQKERVTHFWRQMTNEASERWKEKGRITEKKRV